MVLSQDSVEYWLTVKKVEGLISLEADEGCRSDGVISRAPELVRYCIHLEIHNQIKEFRNLWSISVQQRHHCNPFVQRCHDVLRLAQADGNLPEARFRRAI